MGDARGPTLNVKNTHRWNNIENMEMCEKKVKFGSFSYFFPNQLCRGRVVVGQQKIVAIVDTYLMLDRLELQSVTHTRVVLAVVCLKK